MRVLLTRPAEQSSGAAARLEALGHAALSAPLIEIVALHPTLPPAGFDAVVATSSNALRCLPRVDDKLTDAPLFVVGERTAVAARVRGWSKIEAVARSSEELAAILLARQASTIWLYLAGAPRSPDLERALDRAGRRIFPVIVYEAKPLEAMPVSATAALRRASVDAVLHYSKGAAAAYVNLARRAGLESEAAVPLHIAISARAAGPLRGFARAIRIAESPDEDSLFEQLRGES
jgi:uroporphyrinogen-III synthase